jgi:seryl-tRNA synthetase
MSMTDASDIAELRRRVTLIEQGAEGEKRVSRHILRKITDNERLILDVRGEVGDVKKEVGDVKKEVSELRSEIALLRADLPFIIATVVGSLLREERERRI